MNCLGEKLKKMAANYRVGVLKINEMAKDTGLEYTQSTNSLVDFSVEDCRPAFAYHVLCFKVRLAGKQFKQSVTFYFCGGNYSK